MPTKNKVLLRELQRAQRFRKKVLLKEYFLTHPCVDCGETDFRCLDFDHVRGTKHKNVSVMTRSGYSWAACLREMEKCEVRCANCHRKITYVRRYRLMDKAVAS